ncbi:hypothetical protein AAG906_003475 [Vitis piasezkii]
MTDGIFSNPYVHVETMGSCIMTHLLTAPASRLNCDDCLVIYTITIMTAKVKVPTQHNSDSLLSTIKTLLKHNPESEQQVQTLLCETRRLRKENEVLHIQVFSSGLPCSRQPKSQRTNSKQNEDVSFPNSQEALPKEKLPPTVPMPLDESFDSTRISTKRRRDRRSQLSDTMRAQLGPQIPCMKGRQCVATTHEVYPGPSATAVVPDWPPHPPALQRVGALTNRGPPDSIYRQLDDMFSTPFSPYIIIYEPPRGFMVLKFMTYD